MNAHFPATPWEASPAFLAFLDTLPMTPARAKRMAQAQREAALKREQAEELRREMMVLRAQADAQQEPERKRSWHEGRRQKHVVTGRLHLIEDDDRSGERRTGYTEMNRFTFIGDRNG